MNTATAEVGQSTDECRKKYLGDDHCGDGLGQERLQAQKGRNIIEQRKHHYSAAEPQQARKKSPDSADQREANDEREAHRPIPEPETKKRSGTVVSRYPMLT